jgi:hypothetical protein
MSARHFRLALSAPLAAGALAIAASSLAAQGGGARGAGGFVGRGGGAATQHVAIPPQTVRALIAAHHADIANGTSEDNILTLMIDSNGNYVGSAATKANVVMRVAPNGDTIVATGVGGARGAGGGGAGGVITAAPTGGIARVSAATATPVGEGKMTFAGIGTVDASLVQDMFTTSYEAGEIAPNALHVRFVILKNGVPK